MTNTLENDREMTPRLDEFVGGERDHVLRGQPRCRLGQAVAEVHVIPRVERHQVLIEHGKLGLLRRAGHRSLRKRAEVVSGRTDEPRPLSGTRAFKRRALRWQAAQVCPGS